MDNSVRIEKINSLINKAISPEILEIIDESSKHIGHAGNTSGAGHFAVKIKSDKFTGKSRITVHQMIYKALGEMIGPDIHALRIVIIK